MSTHRLSLIPSWWSARAFLAVLASAALLVSAASAEANRGYGSRPYVPDNPFGTAGGAVERGILTNPSFETGDFSGWTALQLGDSGAWEVNPAGAPLDSGALAPVPSDGQFQAITDMTGPGSRVLYQEFVVPPAGEVSFDMWWDNQSGTWANPGSLDFNIFPNQHARVDIMVAGSDPFATGPEVLQNLLTLDSGPFQGGYVNQSFNIAGLAGQNVRLRFAEVDNQFFFHFAIDNVRVVPEPSGLALFGVALAALARRRGF